MKVDKPSQDVDLSNIPGEFRENYRFLTELINCEHKNTSASRGLEALVSERLSFMRGKLNRRQVKILNQYLQTVDDNDPDALYAPVPAELEASIRIRKRSTWLPWEAEAIRKIDRWRDDVSHIVQHWTGTLSSSPETSLLRPISGKSST